MTIAAEPQGSQLDGAAAVLEGRRIAFLTGAGVSTDSGIPDYRGDGAPRRTPMTIDEFLRDELARKRYWAGSHRGWKMFDAAQPNDGHRAIARFETAGVSSGVVTQNVDSLHGRAGSARHVELHGTLHRVVCLNCGQVYKRFDLARRLDELNPWLEEPDAVVINPDGDADVADPSQFVIPRCDLCGGVLKPEVVFFGEVVPLTTFRLAAGLVAQADALVVAGSSLVVNSGIRIVELARRRELPIVIINRGATKGDTRATVRLDAGTTTTLAALASRLIP
ncbi:Sir2 family NAD-dependent protein deacetylase [Paramicrobacterium agarici]|uniref:protein acetyllysine N-acetyltransferase n=1 Tax=Paramicrobacterium agarici TaxID=630514 RepID=A0A2A9DZ45_9MICO|nr:Sir2 family NAD-dependent protein deacetylase [Microbacterium agarici]PFG31395.1 NAD-dependent SIR2 family protein deacetylase [Microbacterium agarici]